MKRHVLLLPLLALAVAPTAAPARRTDGGLSRTPDGEVLLERRFSHLRPACTSRDPSAWDTYEKREALDQSLQAFFAERGVQWPEGSYLAYIEPLATILVKNTETNLVLITELCKPSLEHFDEMRTHFADSGSYSRWLVPLQFAGVYLGMSEGELAAVRGVSRHGAWDTPNETLGTGLYRAVSYNLDDGKTVESVFACRWATNETETAELWPLLVDEAESRLGPPHACKIALGTANLVREWRVWTNDTAFVYLRKDILDDGKPVDKTLFSYEVADKALVLEDENYRRLLDPAFPGTLEKPLQYNPSLCLPAAEETHAESAEPAAPAPHAGSAEGAKEPSP